MVAKIPNVEGVISIAAVSDGLSNTTALAERVVGDSDDGRNSPGAVRPGPAMRDPSLTTDFVLAQCQTNGPTVSSHACNFGVGLGAQDFGDLHATIHNHLLALNARFVDRHSGRVRIDSPNESAIVTARSYHAGGVSVLSGDGSVRFVRNGVSLAVWRSLGTRAEAEAISAGEY